jgi:hypothetical protein
MRSENIKFEMKGEVKIGNHFITDLREKCVDFQKIYCKNFLFENYKKQNI